MPWIDDDTSDFFDYKGMDSMERGEDYEAQNQAEIKYWIGFSYGKRISNRKQVVSTACF